MFSLNYNKLKVEELIPEKKNLEIKIEN